jgi:hypothetical protein
MIFPFPFALATRQALQAEFRVVVEFVRRRGEISDTNAEGSKRTFLP